MKFSYLLISALLVMSCNSKPDFEEVSKLNGFWEIEKAETPYGDKSYKMNQMVDYFQIEDSIGYRKKMQPNLLGNYKSSQNREYFTVQDRKDSVVLVYKNDYDTWTETLLKIEEDKFVVKNEQNFIYTYKRHEPKTIGLDEK
ncbi:hypothetical protein LB456_10965 [Psychroflexus sp. CAK57W]|uniref:hypothetical protein n=1 Tax=Psychroflexus curvus TaxID=2873595 RepID=UPI001CCAF26C|nr:hypothetical protein [Psychroflexus curvus]MBZ9628575.1 hypothetical protein [Psychroflexus curvus]MBZ9787978.1 hypothetical protein [Psychroflexus curvus]